MTTGFCRSSFWVKTSILVSSFGLHLISLGMVTSFGVMYSGLRDQLNSGAAETSWIASLSSGLFLMFDIAILSGSFDLHVVTIGMLKSFGVTYTAYRHHLVSGVAETSWITSLCCCLAFGPVAGILEKRFGCRLVAMTGSALIGVGMLASAFVPTLFWLYLTYGVITGVGFGMAHLVANVIVNLKFNKRRSMAIAVASAGGGCGNIVIPWLTTIWLEVYGWRQTFLLLAGIGLQGIVFGAIIFKVSTSNDSGGSHRTDHSSDGPSIRAEVSTILKTKMFLVFSVSGFCTAMAYFVPYVMIPELAKVKGVSTTDVALVFSVSGVSSIVGRILVGFIIDVLHIDRIWTLSIALMTGGISTIGYAFVYNKWLFIAYGAILGIFTGTFGFLQSVIVVDLLGTELLGIGFGFLTLFHGIAVIIGPPLAGWISDVTNDYTVPFIYAGCLFCLASFLACVIKIRDYCNFSKCDDHVSSRFDDIPVNNGSYTNSNFVFDTKL